MRAISAVLILLGGFSLLPVRVSSQQERPTFRAESELDVLHVSVRDRGGRYLTDLTRDNFVVIDDGKPQTLEMFSAEEVPASVGVLVDNSNSMLPNRDRVIASAVSFARSSHPKDEIFVLAFNESVRRAWGPAVAGTMDSAAFASAMDAAIVGRGMTAIYDGLLAGLEYLGRATHTRQVLVVVSDGGDNASKATMDEALKRVRESDATIYSVALVDPLLRDGNPDLLRRLSHSTGGESYRPRRTSDIDEAFAAIAKDIRSAYTLAYTPTRHDTDAGERRRRTVKVYVRDGGRALRVRVRDGYFEKAAEEQR
jgi:VWFA-related protein